MPKPRSAKPVVGWACEACLFNGYPLVARTQKELRAMHLEHGSLKISEALALKQRLVRVVVSPAPRKARKHGK